MYIIQTNTSIVNDKPMDFQSLMYKINKQTWEEFKEYIISNEDYTEKIINGTMIGSTKPLGYKTESVVIDDNFHLEVIMVKNGIKVNSKYYLVTDEQFKNLIY